METIKIRTKIKKDRIVTNKKKETNEEREEKEYLKDSQRYLGRFY
jgi:hypothetical protein